MNKKWDNTGIAYNVKVWKECLRVLKPGGYLLAFGGTRTYHRMVCAIEDAGFEIRDQIQWIYGSGFPKSHDISKAIDKKMNVTRKKKSIKFITPHAITDKAKEWDGWGTALKPANEPIVVARKPLSEKTVINNVLKWGTGGINIDDCRIPFNMEDKNPATNPLYRVQNGYKIKCGSDNNGNSFKIKAEPMDMNVHSNGRFPANVILDEKAVQMLDKQTGILKSGGRKKEIQSQNGMFGNGGIESKKYNSNSDGASRFFYCAKASKKEKGNYNNHPTVKPINLIEYLLKLVTPKNGISLDPFSGSGTHAVACNNLGFRYIGFEKEKEYYNLILKRIEDNKNKL